ncbi:MAG: RDD family protein, partial [Verrucomicrobiota bacterium]
ELIAMWKSMLESPEWQALARVQLFALIGWHFVEAVLIHLFGATPGKALLNIGVRHRGDLHPTPLRSLGRSFIVYMLGVGFYFFPFSLIAGIFSLFRLLATGKSLWDQQLGTRVEMGTLGPLRIILAIIVFFALVGLQSIRIV